MLQPDRIYAAKSDETLTNLILKGGVEIPDRFTRITGDEPIMEGPVIVDLGRLDAAIGANHPLGVALANTDDVSVLAPYLARLDVVVLHFPKFTDGRAYSQARILRQQFGYRGEIRATGQVLPDQLAFMHRCGFDAFVLAKGDPVTAWDRAMTTFSRHYQPASDTSVPAFIRRRENAK